MKTILAIILPAVALTLAQANRPVTFLTTPGAFTYSGNGCPDGSASINYAREDGVASINFTPPFAVTTPDTLERSCTIRLDVQFPGSCFNTTLNHTPNGRVNLASDTITGSFHRALDFPGLASGEWDEPFVAPDARPWISTVPWTVVSDFADPTVIRLTAVGQLRFQGTAPSGTADMLSVETWSFDVRQTRECCESTFSVAGLCRDMP